MAPVRRVGGGGAGVGTVCGQEATGVERVPWRGEWRGGSVPPLTSGGTLPVSGSVDGLSAFLRGSRPRRGARPCGAGRGGVNTVPRGVTGETKVLPRSGFRAWVAPGRGDGQLGAASAEWRAAGWPAGRPPPVSRNSEAIQSRRIMGGHAIFIFMRRGRAGRRRLRRRQG